jgi:hypothetical protein
MASMSATSPIDIIGGVNTHQDLHTAAVVELTGAVLGASVLHHSGRLPGDAALVPSHGNLVRVGVEATGSYRAGLTRRLALGECRVGGHRPAAGRGTDDTLDAIAAARAAFTGQRVSVAKDCCGATEALRVLCTTRKTAARCRRVPQQPAVTVGTGLLHVTVTARWIPLVPRWLWHAGGMAGEHDALPDGDGAPRAEDEACPWRPLDR